jgi:hypothetical protein
LFRQWLYLYAKKTKSQTHKTKIKQMELAKVRKWVFYFNVKKKSGERPNHTTNNWMDSMSTASRLVGLRFSGKSFSTVGRWQSIRSLICRERLGVSAISTIYLLLSSYCKKHKLRHQKMLTRNVLATSSP